MTNEELLKELNDRFEKTASFWSPSRLNELDDLKFYGGSPDNAWQWPSEVLSSRSNGGTSKRPTLTFNHLPQHVHQVTNQQRMSRPSVNVIPINDEADLRVANVLKGIIRHIEYMSDADIVYNTAIENQVVIGEGYWRITTEYVDDMSFEQHILLKRIKNSFTVLLDPNIKDPSGLDAEYAFIEQILSKEEFQRLYPKYKDDFAQNFDSIEYNVNTQIGVGNNFVRIVEYFYKEYTNIKVNLYISGENFEDGTEEDAAARLAYGEPIKSRKSKKCKIFSVKSNGKNILEKNIWVGSYIPIVRVVGNEVQVEGQTYLSGIVRNAKDAQRMFNYWKSQEAEMLALAPKAPFIGYAGQFEGFEDEWGNANTTNYAYLQVKDRLNGADPSSPVLPLPQRSQPPMAQIGLIEAASGAAEEIKATTGQYNASLGMTSNERSGVAISAREKQSETGTYHFVDNASRAIVATGKQLLDIIPKIYDTERIALILGENSKIDKVKIDPNSSQAVQQVMGDQGEVIQEIYNPNVGKYSVIVEEGPNYATKRQEARDAIFKLVQTNPNLWSVAGDLLVKNEDWEGSYELSNRLAKTIPADLLEDDNTPPIIQAYKKQMMSLQQQLQEAMALLQKVPQSFEQQEALRKDLEVQIKAYQAETDRLYKLGKSDEKTQDIAKGTIDAMIETGEIIEKLNEKMLDTSPNQEVSEKPQVPEQKLESEMT